MEIAGKTSPGLAEFMALTKSHRVVPVCVEFVSDIETTTSAYLKLGCPRDSFVLESVQDGERLGRHSFIGLEPLATFTVKGFTYLVDDKAGVFGAPGSYETEGNPMEALRQLWKKAKPAVLPGLPVFYGGAVGYMGYDVVRHFEHLPSQKPDSLGVPDSYLLFPKLIVVFDHVANKLQLICNAIVAGSERDDDDEGAKAAEAAYKAALRSLEGVVAKLLTPLPLPNGSLGPEDFTSPSGDGALRAAAVTSNVRPSEFMTMVKRAKEHIERGDVFQVVLSQRFAAAAHEDAFSLYRKLRSGNPSPYMFFLNLPDVQLVGSSPEVLVRLTGTRAELRPIAGTRPRGRCDAEDSGMATELLADPKERAEHIMLVDLGRNDLGRVCVPGSVKVGDLMSVERYSHVMHIASGICGTLAPDKDLFHLLEAAFPAGTVTGAPKVRAMELIDELEPARRGPYAGIVGYFCWSGDMDTCIAIRTLIVKEGVAYAQAGAGIVADSDAAREYAETVAKARALFAALGVEGGMAS